MLPYLKNFVKDGLQKSYGFSIIKLVVILGLIFGFIIFFTHRSGFSFVNTDLSHIDAGLLPQDDFTPEHDSNRINILLLGIRGINDANGGLLSDTIMLASVKKDTGDVALLSVPRDLYVYITRTRRDKLNAVYAFGESISWGGGGLELSQKIISQITGERIDYSMSVDFEAFEKFIDILGGITIILDKPFIEYEQWRNYPERLKEENKKYWRLNEEQQRWEMHIDEGEHLLDGEMTLYYVRARFSSSDFDRARRQQQVIAAIKDKAFSLGVLANPIKVMNILETINKNTRRDFSILEIKELLDLSEKIQGSRIINQSLDISLEGLLYSTTINDLYVLLPVGNNYNSIRDLSKNIFE